MVSAIESTFKRCLKNLIEIWLLLCLATLLSSILYLNHLTTHSQFQRTATGYALFDRHCSPIPGFERSQIQAPFYYPMWAKAQAFFDQQHRRSHKPCQPPSTTP